MGWLLYGDRNAQRLWELLTLVLAHQIKDLPPNREYVLWGHPAHCLVHREEEQFQGIGPLRLQHKAAFVPGRQWRLLLRLVVDFVGCIITGFCYGYFGSIAIFYFIGGRALAPLGVILAVLLLK